MEATNRTSLTQEQLDLIERFITAYNGIDHCLREALNAEPNIPFSRLVQEYAARYPKWREKDTLHMAADLRNVVIHQRERSYEYLSVPVPSIVGQVERIRDQFTSPERVYPKFQREVHAFQASDRLSSVLSRIDEKEFSQFPIFEQGCFIGLLTENGIARWLARHSLKAMTLIDVGEVLTRDVLSQEEQRHNCQFISRDTTALDAENQFVRNTMLEALLITQTGKPGEKLLGIVTRWDLVEL